MFKTWSLKELYTSFDSAEYRADYEQLEQLIHSLDSISETLKSSESLEHYFRTLEKIQQTAIKLISFSNLMFSVDTSHEKALQAKNKLQKLLSKTTSAETRLTQFLSSTVDLDTLITGSEYLESLSFIISEQKNKSRHMLSEPEELLLSELSITGSKSWNTLQSKLVSKLTAPFSVDGETKDLPITTIRNFAYDPSPEVRKRAYETELSAYKTIDEAVAMALNSIKGEVITTSKMRGYDSPLHMTLKDSRMTKGTLDAMMTAIEDSLPEFQNYLWTKAKVLGHEKGLPFYDLFAPVGSFSKQYAFEEGSQFVVDNFRSFSDKLANVAQMALDNHWIDVEPREGKVSGAFCASLHPLGQFRIMLNYTGNLSDVTTMAHELGHGYHAICTNDENILNTHYPMPLAETASTFCETIVNNAALGIASAEESITILENSLQDATQVICDIFSRYTFETDLFENRSDHPLSVSELNALMTNAQKKAYGEGLDKNSLHPYMWLIKPHYYSAERNFYNFPYAFGLLFAKGLYAKYLENPEFFKANYDELLAVSGRLSIVDVCKTMSIDVESVDFWNASLNIIKKDIDLFIKLTASEVL
ncbi:MAG: M3 family oligoendopeptidase [Clostridia bacterium]|nr:M3 family oligoendopeptidase [Clostridia bacterium]